MSRPSAAGEGAILERELAKRQGEGDGGALLFAALLLASSSTAALAVSAFAVGANVWDGVKGGASYGATPDAAAAQAEALDKCSHASSKPIQCRVIALFSNTCFAIAADSSQRTTAYAYTQNPNLKSALSHATIGSDSLGGLKRQVLSSYCDKSSAAPGAAQPAQLLQHPPMQPADPGDCQQFPALCGYKL